MKTKHWFLTFFFIVAVSASGNAQWVKQSGGLPSTWLVGDAIDAVGPSAAVIAVRAAPAMMYMTSDGGAHFRALKDPSAFPDLPVDVSMTDTLHIWVVTPSRILATTNGGTSWQQQFYDTTQTQFFDYVKMFDLNNGVAVGDANAGKQPAILQTVDGGAHWTNMNTSSLPNMVSGDMWRRIDFVNKSVGYFYTSGGSDNPQKTYKTTNGGASWSPVLSGGGTILRFYNEQIGFERGGYPLPQIYRTFNGGITWDTIAVNNAQPGWGNDIEFLPGNPARVWYTDYNNLLFSSDTGRTWSQQVIDTGKVFGRDIVFTDATHGWLLCDNGRLYRTVNGNQIVSSVGNAEAVVPSGFQLEQNYPNPFNPTTNFEFRIGNCGSVSLKVFDVLGREVATLVNGMRPAGVYKVRWDASSLPSGVYFYRLQAGGFTQSRAMVLMK
ncbi:MAG: T9SS type A sorting domain-containing protein [Ignavibacteriales bacterium]|nr:T9SS type A sorting domain-containing protein [Ignavibacteriales bacterium]